MVAIHQIPGLPPHPVPYRYQLLVPKAMEQITLVEGYIGDARATGNLTWEPAWTQLAREVGKLKSEIANRYVREIEGLALEKQPESSRARMIEDSRVPAKEQRR